MQALARSQPAFPMMPGMPEKRTHDYVRHGTTSLFAAFNTADGTVISAMHRRHRTIEFKKFLTKIDAQVPAELDVHLVCDNYGTHKSPAIKKWLAAHPRFHVHYTPTYSSWINQVERWFAYLTDDLLRRSDHRTVQALERDIRAWVSAWNEDPKPVEFVIEVSPGFPRPAPPGRDRGDPRFVRGGVHRTGPHLRSATGQTPGRTAHRARGRGLRRLL